MPDAQGVARLVQQSRRPSRLSRHEGHSAHPRPSLGLSVEGYKQVTSIVWRRRGGWRASARHCRWPRQGLGRTVVVGLDGALIRNERGQVLAFERADHPGSWQFPQGGVTIGEGLERACFRELLEETGLQASELTIYGRLPFLLFYELPAEARSVKTGRGQIHYWYVFELASADCLPDLSKSSEFRNFEWIEPAVLLERVRRTASFRELAYRQLFLFLSESEWKRKLLKRSARRGDGG